VTGGGRGEKGAVEQNLKRDDTEEGWNQSEPKEGRAGKTREPASATKNSGDDRHWKRRPPGEYGGKLEKKTGGIAIYEFIRPVGPGPESKHRKRGKTGTK